ncbi:hypothetical protein NC653_031084 [Populus alba x Populus x berolinensis]|uniref:Uncharacterized protein n=1 Tax=Populus alba x Populus x berolinensis TaxID=444605 RepID=A0AAD6Q0Y6_9ROSI|nr:hypothetical protein NC653_031084 [Populus alba x Populus x berolinensis]
MHFPLPCISVFSLCSTGGSAISEDNKLQNYELTDIWNSAKCKQRHTRRAVPTTDSAINIMIAGHDTTSILSFLIKLLVNDPSVYGSIVQGMRLNSRKSLKFETAEQEDIAKSKVSKDLLAWDDLARMKDT